ncbi:MAG: endopeptidase La [Anaerolineales bacterium]|nr:endopeptidase La [Anaerolineales bacterium]
MNSIQHYLHTNPMEIAVGLEADVFDTTDPILDDDGLVECPLIPLRDMVMYPRMISPLFIGRERSINAANAANVQENALIVVAQRDVKVEDPFPEDLYMVGAWVSLGRQLRMPDGMISVLAQGRYRVEIVEFVQREPYIRVRARLLREPITSSSDQEALMHTVLSLFEKIISLSSAISEDLYIFAMNIDEPGWLADLVASVIRLDLFTRQELLETLDPIKRLDKVSVLLAKELDLLELEDRIHSSVQQQVDISQREHFLREQLKAIQTELGEGDLFTQELDELRLKAEEKELPEHVQLQFKREIKRLESMPPGAPESGIIRTYLNWLLDLPWLDRTDDNLDLPSVARALDADHYGLDKAKERILEYLAVKQLAPDKMKSPILCFAGPPGTGKTSLGKSIAKALGREFVRLSLGGVHDEAEIRGHRRTYIGALPGRIIQTMRRAGTINPLFMLDEIDKLGADFRGDPSSALLEVLDPEQNHAFSDHYLELDFDLSQVMFITTANFLDPIPPALQDRLEVIEFPGYTEEEKVVIARQFIIPKQLEANGVQNVGLHFSDSALETLIRDYTYESGVRNLEREIAKVCRKVARRVAEKKRHPRRISSNQVEDMLGPPGFFTTLPMDQDEVGVATGVAWTPSGGELMAIEVALMKEGKGNITLTGQLGEVMQESAQTAYSYLRGRFRELGLSAKVFDRLDVHIHAPEGAVPKDGPSAGVTLVAALASAFTNRPVIHTIGMTGEVTLRGRVLPVGGVKEKLLTVRRAGLNQFILPRKNEKDLVEVPKRLLKDIEIILVDRVSEVLDLVLLPPLDEEE